MCKQNVVLPATETFGFKPEG